MTKKHSQYGFFAPADLSELRVRPQKGDEMIKPPGKKPTKSEGKAPGPYKEVIVYEGVVRRRMDDTGGVWMNENGGLLMRDAKGNETLVGEDGTTWSRVSETDVPDLPQLSPKARGFFKQRHGVWPDGQDWSTQPSEPEGAATPSDTGPGGETWPDGTPVIRSKVDGRAFVPGEDYDPYASTYPGPTEDADWENLRRMATAALDILRGRRK